MDDTLKAKRGQINDQMRVVNGRVRMALQDMRSHDLSDHLIQVSRAIDELQSLTHALEEYEQKILTVMSQE